MISIYKITERQSGQAAEKHADHTQKDSLQAEKQIYTGLTHAHGLEYPHVLYLLHHFDRLGGEDIERGHQDYKT